MLTLLAVAALMTASDPDGVVTTAPRAGDDAVLVGAVAPVSDARPDAAARAAAVTPQDLTTQQQIDRWLSARSPEAQVFSEDAGPVDDRRMHGFVSGAIGTGDYSAVSMGVSLPIGENGRLDLMYGQSRNEWGYPGYGYGYPGGYGYGALGHGGRVRPYGGYDSFHGERKRSGRSMSLGFSWDESDDRRERAPAPTAED
jgi:hypothetical protein